MEDRYRFVTAVVLDEKPGRGMDGFLAICESVLLVLVVVAVDAVDEIVMEPL